MGYVMLAGAMVTILVVPAVRPAWLAQVVLAIALTAKLLGFLVVLWTFIRDTLDK